jgi:hypothetical protein
VMLSSLCHHVGPHARIICGVPHGWTDPVYTHPACLPS